MTELPRESRKRPGPDWLPGGWATVIAFMAAVALCIGASILYYLNLSADHEQVTSPGPPPIVSEPTSPAPAAPPARAITTEFRDFAMEGEPFTPEWLIRVKRVYWTDDGALWADAMMPRNPPERVFTIDKICQRLSEYVTDVVRRGWPGISVRSTDGEELLTRAKPSDPCRPAG
jgi:hypothetical protein